MDLSIQLQVLTVSFVYGILFSYLLKIQYKFLFETKFFYKLLITVLFIFDNCLLYFIILKMINHGMFHLYFLFSLIIGFLFGNYLIKLKKKNWHFLCKKTKDVILFDWKIEKSMVLMIIGDETMVAKKKKIMPKYRLVLFLPACLLVIITIFATIGSYWVQISQKYQEKNRLEDEILSLKEEEEILKVDVERLQDPDYVARYAREKYMYSKDGEIILRFSEEDE